MICKDCGNSAKINDQYYVCIKYSEHTMSLVPFDYTCKNWNNDEKTELDPVIFKKYKDCVKNMEVFRWMNL